MKTFLKILLLVAALAAALPVTHAATDGLTGLPLLERKEFTNNLSGVGGLHNTNVIYHFTNGSTTVTSAPVALRGKGFTLELQIAFTNALVTNVVNEFRFSTDGTNWANEPTLTLRTATAAHAVGQYTALTNVLEDAFRHFKWIQHWKLHATNGVNTVGEVFATNRSPVIVVQHYD